MDKFNKIRPVALGIVIRDGKVLASKGYDKAKDIHFYRVIGGGIELFEKSSEALKREFLEETGANITIEELLEVEENIFTYNGMRGHEITFIYKATMDEKDYKETYYEEGDSSCLIEWVDINDIKSGETIIYPTSVTKYL